MKPISDATSLSFEKVVDGEPWAVCYSRAISPDGKTFFFPNKLSAEYLQRQRKAQGSYIFAHQYNNEIIPSDQQDFKKEWIKYRSERPTIKHTFAFIDPAISLEKTADYTAIVVADVDLNNDWYVHIARRARITATQTVKLIFDLQATFKCQMIGVETVAYQLALMHFLDAEMRKRKVTLPVTGIKRGPDKSKNTRIRSLVPRFEWGRIFLKPGLHDLEDELAKFPRGSYVDLLDSLASISDIAYPPERPKESNVEPAPNSPDYEKWYIRNKLSQKRALED